MSFHYNFILVALSIAVAIQASFVGLSLAHLVPGAFAANRRRLLAGATVSLAIGIWGMHFIGMLAIETPIRIDYAILPTLISFLICALVTGVAIYLASLRSTLMLIVGSVIMGTGIASMHFVGMMALHASVHMEHAPLFVLASIAIAIVASGLSLALAFMTLRRPAFWLCAVAMGIAISGMHYMAMAGTAFHSMPSPDPAGEAISGDYLAMIVSVVAFSISGAFMLTLVPSASDEKPIRETFKASGLPHDAAISRGPSESVAIDRSAREGPLAPVMASPPLDMCAALPIEKNRSRCQIALTDIVSVHSNAHYTYIFDGHDDLFCPLTISEIAERLPKQTFYRTHRSYIVSLAHVVSVKKAANSGVAEIGSPVRRTVPISRNRISDLRACLMAFQADAHTGENRI
ncbi:MHYT domain-containing protein [Beijerinckia sp. L45]|uniref:MHYT domain-containing protein n=1 Tax=Beijerinckia sp. L45 TaxID=1641855 RepID=UPI00131C7552|nr:MHYT domain-containing protein [Beijerinckia sp. L45]